MPKCDELLTPCPKCGQKNTVVIDSRQMDTSRRRRRECRNKKCEYRWTTHEFDADFVIEMQEAIVKLRQIEVILALTGETP